ncbi:MAG TPA: hypothetical protein GX005_06855 [Bacteroidales bacterium]|nr:hypothetical protein [Bacteroidales bacterium]
MDYIIEWATVNKEVFYLPLGIAVFIFVTYHQLRIIKKHKKNIEDKKDDRDKF